MQSSTNYGNWSDYETRPDLYPHSECDYCGRKRGKYKPEVVGRLLLCKPCQEEG